VTLEVINVEYREFTREKRINEMNIAIPVLISVATGLMAAFIELVPPVQKTWNANFSPARKQLVIGGLAFVIGLLAMGYNCQFLSQCPVTQNEFGKAVIDLLVAVGAGLGGAVIGHQSTNAKNITKAGE